MNCLEHRGIAALGIQIRTCRKSHATGNRGTEVSQYITEEIGCDDNFKALRVPDHEHGGCVDEQVASLDCRVFPAYLFKYLVPEDHGIIEGISLAHGGEGSALFFCELECISDDALTALAGEDAVLDHDLFRLILIEPGSASGVFALGVFSDESHIDVFPFYICKRTGSTFQELDRSQIDILVK